jgi:hypothetical protein
VRESPPGARGPRGGHALDPVRVVRGQRVADEVSGVVADHGEPLVAERIHQRDQVGGEGAGVVPGGGLVGPPDAALVDRDDLEVPGQRRHHPAPRVPVLRPAVHEQQRRPLAADDRVQAHLAGVDEPAAERAPEPRGEVRRARAPPAAAARLEAARACRVGVRFGGRQPRRQRRAGESGEPASRDPLLRVRDRSGTFRSGQAGGR